MNSYKVESVRSKCAWLVSSKVFVFAVVLFILVPNIVLASKDDDDYVSAVYAYQKKDYKTTYSLLSPLAEKGNHLAQYLIGNLYYEGHGVLQNYKTALGWFEKSAIQDNTNAIVIIGFMYRHGVGVEKNLRIALNWYMKAAELDDAEAMAEIAVMHALGINGVQDKQLAYKWNKKASERGNAKAQYNLAIAYEKGDGVKEDLDKAFDWYSKSAKHGFRNAQYKVGEFYEIGNVVKRNAKQAIQWYKKSAEQGYAEAQTRLGYLYYIGEDVELDYNQAAKWFEKAATQKQPVALYFLASMYDTGRGRKLNKKKAFELYENSALQKYGPASYEVAEIYRLGEVVEKDLYKAFAWYHISAEAGEARAQAEVARIYRSGKLAGIWDLKKSFIWYLAAANQGDRTAITLLGHILHKGQGVPKDIKEAASWYKRAEKNGSEISAEALEEIKLIAPQIIDNKPVSGPKVDIKLSNVNLKQFTLSVANRINKHVVISDEFEHIKVSYEKKNITLNDVIKDLFRTKNTVAGKIQEIEVYASTCRMKNPVKLKNSKKLAKELSFNFQSVTNKVLFELLSGFTGINIHSQGIDLKRTFGARVKSLSALSLLESVATAQGWKVGYSSDEEIVFVPDDRIDYTRCPQNKPKEYETKLEYDVLCVKMHDKNCILLEQYPLNRIRLSGYIFSREDEYKAGIFNTNNGYVYIEHVYPVGSQSDSAVLISDITREQVVFKQFPYSIDLDNKNTKRFSIRYGEKLSEKNYIKK